MVILVQRSGGEIMSTSPEGRDRLPFALQDQADFLHGHAGHLQSGTGVDGGGAAGDVLRTIDELSLTLEELRNELDALEKDWPPSAA